MQKEPGLALLRRMLGTQAEFRKGQWEAIDAAANRRERLLVVQRTGWGKSIVYFGAAKILRDSGGERLAWLAQFLPQIPGNGIVYTLTIQNARRVAAWLQQRGVNARAYHSELGGEARISAEQQLLNNEVKALVATVALGMGFDNLPYPVLDSGAS